MILFALSFIYCCADVEKHHSYRYFDYASSAHQTSQMCCDAVEVALSRSSSILDAADSARSVNSAVRNVFSALTTTFATTSGNRGIGDVPRALISLLQRHGASALGEGGRVFRFDNENLQRGAVLSLGLGRINLSERERTGSEGCAYSYSSLLRLSLFLTSISEKELRSLLPSLLHLNEQWPKIILKAFSHRYSSRVADQNAPTSMITLSPDSQVVALILEVSHGYDNCNNFSAAAYLFFYLGANRFPLTMSYVPECFTVVRQACR